MKKLFLTIIPIFALLLPSIAPAANLMTLEISQLATATNPDWLLSMALAGFTINAANIKDAFTGFKTAFQKGLNSASKPLWQRVATLVPSNTAQEHYGWLGSIPRLREWIGDRHINNLKNHDYSIKNKDYELTIGIDRNEFEDDTFGVHGPAMEFMGDAASSHPDELVFTLLAAGFDTECFDGQFFFDTDHPVGDGVVSNMQAGANPPWFLLDTSRPLKPLIYQQRKKMNFVSMTADTDDAVFMQKKFIFGVDGRSNAGFGFWQMAFGSKATLTAANYEAARAFMKGQKDEHGKPLAVVPNLLVCGSSSEAAARKVIAAEKIDGGDTNTLFNDVEIMVVPWLD